MHICDLCGKSENVRLVKDIFMCEKCRRNLVKIYILSNDKSKPKHIIKRKSVFYTGLFTIFALVMLMVKILT